MIPLVVSIIQKRVIRLKMPELPNILNSYDDWLQVHNKDLPELDDLELCLEKLRAQTALVNIDPQREPVIWLGPTDFLPASQWLFLRLAAIKREQQRRSSKEGEKQLRKRRGDFPWVS